MKPEGISMLGWRSLGALAALLLGLAGAACAKAGSGEAIEERTWSEYAEGGTLSLTATGQPVTVEITDAIFANTDVGYPDGIELRGPDTYIYAEVPNKIEDGEDGLSDYKPILNRPQSIKEGADPLMLNMPGLGKYPIQSGSITLEKYDHGMDGRVWWEGRISLVVTTNAGPQAISGGFAFGIVPVW
jgi:hypothetical protein